MEGRTVKVTNLSEDFGKESLRPLFKKFGKINLITVADGAAVIEFQKTVSARTSIASMNNAVLGGKRVFVSLTDDPAALVQRQGKPKEKRSFCMAFLQNKCKSGDACELRHIRPICMTVKAGGVCPEGDACVFSHDVTADPKAAMPKATKTAPATATAPATREGGAPLLLCKWVEAGRACTFGAKCTYSHDPATAVKTSSILCKNTFNGMTCLKERKGQCPYSHDPATGTAPKSTKPCAAIVAGKKCHRGAKCLFNHDVVGDVGKRKDAPESAAVAAPAKKAKTVVAPPAADTADACAECGKATAAVTCAQCDAALCLGCDATLHASRIMSKHTRMAVAVDARCAECRADKATVHCTKCELDFCNKCSWAIHEFKVFRTHRREALKATKTPVVAATVESTPTKPVVKKAAATAVVVVQPQTELSDDSSSDDEDEEKVVTKAIVTPTKKPTAAPQLELSDTSESSDDDMDDVPAVIAKPAAAPAVKTVAKATPKMELSDDESDDSNDVVDTKPVVAAAAPKRAAVPQTELSDTSESSDDDDDVKPAVVKPTAVATKRAAVPQTELSSDSSDDDDATPAAPPAKKPKTMMATPTSTSSHSLVKKIEAYAASESTDMLHLSPSLNGYERLLAHDCAERLGLLHESVGEGLDRHITVAKGGKDGKKKSWTKSRKQT
ncbi:Aste57867_15818 [Aphanomyces stellatus]|uniref:Aste57867_15818 protein n=1 Tax=Aphanomyces stellatus TaxID=120398 RepID=A0A485L3Y9_9STRA|nr:hypothetical protein As57867_015762 [Aphanomyces stellatus]VFT92606.1 Aste57867_15818 [Aphanomyces stellatus]